MTACGTCQRPRKPGARFCAGCGTALPSDDAVRPASEAPTSATVALDNPSSGVNARTSSAPEPASEPIQQRWVSQNLSATGAGSQSGHPGNHVLANNGDRIDLFPGEEVLDQESFTPSLLAPHIRSSIICTNLRVITHHPAVIFGLFPVGYSIAQAPHSRIDHIASGSRVRGPRVAIGVVLILMSLFLMLTGGLATSGSFGFLMMLFAVVAGAVLIATARVIGVFVTAGDGVLGAVGRGHELDAMRQSADRMTRLLLATEPPRVPLH